MRVLAAVGAVCALSATTIAQTGSLKADKNATRVSQGKASLGNAGSPSLRADGTTAKVVTSVTGRGAANDECGGAVALSGSPVSATFDSTVNTTGADGQANANCVFFGQGGITLDEWFVWTANATGNANVSTCGAGTDTKIAVYSGATCPPGAAIACNDDACGLQTTTIFAATMGQQYLIQIGTFPGAAGGTGTMTVTGPSGGGGGPMNDNCAGATAVGDGTHNYDLTGATNDYAGTCGATGVAEDIWFAYTASCTGSATVSTCAPLSAGDTVLTILDECGGTQILCLDDFCGLQTQVNFPVVAGEDYFIRIADFNGGVHAGQFSVSCALPATNDNCAGATAITGAGPHNFDNSAATTDGVADPLCLAFGLDQVENDVWFVWGPANCGPNEQVEVAFCGQTGVDTRVAIYDNGTSPTAICPTGNAIVACNDDSCGLQSRATFAPTNGNFYLIRVGTFPGAAGGVGTFTTNCLFVSPPVCTTYNVATDCQETAFIVANNITTFAAAESVTSAAGSITNACIQGLYFNNVPVPDGYVVTAYTDGGGVPGTVIDTFTQGVDVVVTGPAPTGAVFVGRDVQEWNFVFARPIPAASGVCVWLEFRNNAAGDTVFQMDGNASNGNLQAAQDINQDGIYQTPGDVLANDLFVCINGGFLNNSNCFIDPCAGLIPANDDCANAIALTVGTPVNGDTSCASVDAVTSCSGVALAPGVWYTFTGTGNTMTVDTCASANYDTRLELYCGPCDNLVCAGANDDSCGLQSAISFCTTAGETYRVLVHGFGGATGVFDITLSDDGVPCTGAPNCAPCTGITCPSGSVAEGELCGEDLNGGCNYAAGLPTMFEALDCNLTVCGTSFGAGGTRDTDWYLVTAPATGVISATLTADFSAVTFILDLGTPVPNPAPCGTITLLAQGAVLPCGTTTIQATGLIPGNSYVVFVAPSVFDGVPCDANYFLTVDQGISCVPCCDFDNNGVINSQDFFDFLIAFFASGPAADFNGDGVVNSQDFFDFIVCFFAPPAGCP